MNIKQQSCSECWRMVSLPFDMCESCARKWYERRQKENALDAESGDPAYLHDFKR